MKTIYAFVALALVGFNTALPQTVVVNPKGTHSTVLGKTLAKLMQKVVKADTVKLVGVDTMKVR